MHQINLKHGTKRAVKRRPEKALTNEDMEDLTWYVHIAVLSLSACRNPNDQQSFFPSLVFPSFSKTKHTTKYKYCDQLSKTVTGVLDFQKAFMKREREGKKWGSLCFMTFSVTSFFIFFHFL